MTVNVYIRYTLSVSQDEKNFGGGWGGWLHNKVNTLTAELYS